MQGGNVRQHSHRRSGLYFHIGHDVVFTAFVDLRNFVLLCLHQTM